MNNHTTYCMGINCRDRQECKRFIDGRKENRGIYHKRLRQYDYNQCEHMIKSEASTTRKMPLIEQ